jgi:hypothetical protein
MVRGRCVWSLVWWFLSLSAQEITLAPLEFEENRVFRYRVHDFVADFARTNFYLFSKESLLVGMLTAPFYGLARKADDRIHSSIYDCCEHKNLFDIGSCSKFFVEDVGLAIPIVGLSVGLLMSRDPNNRVTASMLIGGLCSIGIAKEALKAVSSDCEIGNRPYCSFFKKKRVHNGFPSGHAATATYMTLLFAFRKGIKWAFPIGVYSGLIMGLMVGCNYHYASQIVAGVGLGTVYALAANKVAESRLKENWEINFSVSRKGAPRFLVEYSF